jgi:hypothetical protein
MGPVQPNPNSLGRDEAKWPFFVTSIKFYRLLPSPGGQPGALLSTHGGMFLGEPPGLREQSIF